MEEPPRRPESLTYTHAKKCLPGYEPNPDWVERPGLLGMAGCIRQVPAEETLTREEAAWVAALAEMGSMRWVAGMVFNDDNQIFGMDIIEVARKVAESASAPKEENT